MIPSTAGLRALFCYSVMLNCKYTHYTGWIGLSGIAMKDLSVDSLLYIIRDIAHSCSHNVGERDLFGRAV